AGQSLPLATLGGVVTAEDGKPVPGVKVRLSSPALQGVRQGATTEAGQYLIALLPPGSYEGPFTAARMREAVRGISRTAGAAVRLDQVLEPVPVEESVTVLASQAAPERGPEVGVNFPQQLMNVLPSGRTVRDATLLAPGVNENGPNASLGSASQRP